MCFCLYVLKPLHCVRKNFLFICLWVVVLSPHMRGWMSRQDAWMAPPLCMHVRMCMCDNACMYSCIHARLNASARYMDGISNVHACACVCVYFIVYACMYACMHVCMYACMHARAIMPRQDAWMMHLQRMPVCACTRVCLLCLYVYVCICTRSLAIVSTETW